MGYEYDSQVNRELARTAMDIYKKAHKIDQPINESPQNLNEEVIRENVNGLIMNYISDVIILAEAQMGREMTDIEISEASDELLRRIDSISDTDKVAFINELSEAAGAGMVAAPSGAAAIGSQAGKGNVMGGAGSGAAAAPARGFGLGRGPSAPGVAPTRPTAGGGFDVANYAPASEGGLYATAQEALDAMFEDGFTNGQQIAMVLGQNWSAGNPGMSQG